MINRSIIYKHFKDFTDSGKKTYMEVIFSQKSLKHKEHWWDFPKILSNCYYAWEFMFNSFSKPQPEYNLNRMSWRRTIMTFLITFTVTGILCRFVLEGKHGVNAPFHFCREPVWTFPILKERGVPKICLKRGAYFWKGGVNPFEHIFCFTRSYAIPITICSMLYQSQY